MSGNLWVSSKEGDTWPKKNSSKPYSETSKTRVRESVKAILEEGMTEHLKTGYRELTPTRKGEDNGHYRRSLLASAGKKIECIEVFRDREKVVAEVFERYWRLTQAMSRK